MTLATASGLQALVCKKPVELGDGLSNDPVLMPSPGVSAGVSQGSFAFSFDNPLFRSHHGK